MPAKSSNKSLIAVVVVVILALTAFLVLGWADLPAIHMSSHGWFALGLGVVFSIILGAVLSAVLIIGRRRGFDESAHEAVIDHDPEN
jgi:membrane protein implicated in regulation of membrane protease activity